MYTTIRLIMSAEPPTEGEFASGYVHTDSDGSWTYNDGKRVDRQLKINNPKQE